jgi:hypothetical protein
VVASEVAVNPDALGAYPPDIGRWIAEHFQEPESIYADLSELSTPERVRVARCVLFGAGRDRESVRSRVRIANADYRDIIFFTEYNSREVRRYDFNRSLYDQREYTEGE